MAKIVYLPAKDCIFFRLGFCLYEEILNPGYFTKFRCKILQKWEKDYDNLLDRAEIFGLDLEMVEKIWSKGDLQRYEEMKTCSRFQEGGDSLCRYLYGDICLLNLPECKGRCDFFQLSGDKK
ncbi:hypothetical protein SAMN04488516_101424 [Desulfonauticus submarinus]|uniref:Uncharacterized protein n=1 Tax=Desulfonauticus submarinus TaxID=206665 RepID=A0A1H0AHW7_9BACT|nr:hypothetical protein [Desulfonauticus submarinus]SDN33172.1 hypothetical protein SAMN04488516_101424 [Desulfonauticus submarinus]